MSLLSYTTAANTAIFSPSLPSPPPWSTHHTHRTLIVAQARKGISSSRTRRLEKQGKKEDEEEKAAAAEAEAWAARQAELYPEGTGGGSEVYSTGPMPNIEWEEKQDFWEGPQWEGLGFFLKYQWAFGVAFAVFLCIFVSVSLQFSLLATFANRKRTNSDQLWNNPANQPS